MPKSLLADAFTHHVWATIRQIDVCSALDEAQLATTVPGTYGSILDTLRHIVDGDVFYLNILRGGEPEPFDKDTSDLATLRSVMAGHEAEWQRLLAGYEGADPDADVVEHEEGGYETHAPLGVRLGQALYHGTDHRSQVNTALSSLGLEPAAIEGWDIAREDGRMVTIEAGGLAGRD
jgi:uncharacterized damage-inducible protein DinB